MTKSNFWYHKFRFISFCDITNLNFWIKNILWCHKCLVDIIIKSILYFINFPDDFAIQVSLNQIYDMIIEFVISQNIWFLSHEIWVSDIRILDDILISKMNLWYHKSNLLNSCLSCNIKNPFCDITKQALFKQQMVEDAKNTVYFVISEIHFYFVIKNQFYDITK